MHVDEQNEEVTWSQKNVLHFWQGLFVVPFQNQRSSPAGKKTSGSSWVFSHLGVSKNTGTPKWMVFLMENPIKTYDLGGKKTLFLG